METLTKFYSKVKPSKIGWMLIAAEIKEESDDTNRQQTYVETRTPALVNWIVGVIFIYTFLFSIGKLLLGFTTIGLSFLLLAIISGYIMYKNLPREKRTDD